MKVLFVASFAVIATHPAQAQELFIKTLGLPLTNGDGEGYAFSEKLDGSKHFGVWPLHQAAQACFGTSEWPAEVAIPQASVEFELESAQAVEAAAGELQDNGYKLIHPTRLEPWKQTIARLQTDDGLLVGICYTPWLHEAKANQQ